MEVNKKRLSEIFGVSIRTIQNWQDQGMPVARGGGKGNEVLYDSAAVIEWYSARDAAIENEKLRKEVEQLRVDSESDLVPGTIDYERHRLTRAQADAQELKNAKESAEVVETAFCTFVLSRIAGEIASILDGIPLSVQRRLGTFITQEDQSIVYGPSQDHALVVRKDEWGVVVSDNGNPVPLGTRYGGTGATTGDYWGACTNIGAIRQKTARFAPGDTPTNIYWKNSTGFITGQVEGGAVGAWIDITSADEAARMQLIGFYGDNNGKRGFGYKVYNPNSQSWYNLAVVRDTSNTTVDSNGFIKIASPIVKIYGDGRYEANDESEGVTVTRLDVGQYLIEGCEALNSDAAWGGIDGGFEIPTDRNKQPLIWLDFEINADGSVLVKTYHRAHPSAPAFARNERAGLADGDPVDIPADQFVCVRVEMPADCLFNRKKKVAETAPDLS